MQFDGNQTLSTLLDQLRRAPEYIGGLARMTVRSVVVRAPEQWFNHVTVLHIGPAQGPVRSRRIARCPGAVVLEFEQDLDQELSVEELQRIATAWQEAVELGTPRGLQEQVSVYRCSSDPRGDRWPGWNCRLAEKPTSMGPSAATRGPYFFSDLNLFANNLAELATTWLQSNDWANQTNVQQEYRLMIEDRRGRVTRVARVGDNIAVEASCLRDASCRCVLRTKPDAHAAPAHPVQIVDGKALFELKGTIAELDVCLFTQDGEELDRYTESSRSATWGGYAVLRRNGGARSPRISDEVFDFDDVVESPFVPESTHGAALHALHPRSGILIFVSHASTDAELARMVVELLRLALSLPAAAIRCTSVDGYRFAGGADTDEQLREELAEAPAFIGILSQRSVQSQYVLVELGARWVLGKHLLPLLAPGTPASVIGGPLAGKNALRADNRSQLLQMVEEVAHELGIGLEPSSAYEVQVSTIATWGQLGERKKT